MEQLTRIRPADAFDNEFRYYTKLLADLMVLLSSQEDKEAALSWVRKLSTPAYNIRKLRDKRNRYALMLCISLLIDSLEGPFILPPPVSILPDITKIQRPQIAPFEWESDTTWDDEINTYNEILKASEDAARAQKLEEEKVEFKKTARPFQKFRCKPEPKTSRISNCPIHLKKCPFQNYENRTIGTMLDNQFKFLLWLCKPYAAMLLRQCDRLRAAKWIQTLCAINKNMCAIAKGIRNDYMLVLCGHLSNRELVGIFEDYPLDRLLPISEYAQIKTERKPITDPTHPKTAEFFRECPHPEEGAFALLAITGDIYDQKFQ